MYIIAIIMAVIIIIIDLFKHFSPTSQISCCFTTILDTIIYNIEKIYLRYRCNDYPVHGNKSPAIHSRNTLSRTQMPTMEWVSAYLTHYMKC